MTDEQLIAAARANGWAHHRIVARLGVTGPILARAEAGEAPLGDGLRSILAEMAAQPPAPLRVMIEWAGGKSGKSGEPSRYLGPWPADPWQVAPPPRTADS